MDNKNNERYVKLGLTAGAVVLFGLVSYFMLANLKGIANSMRVVGKILAPFVYGAVIAYLLLPLCRKLEATFGKWFRRENSGAVRGLAIALSLLAALIVVLAVMLLMIPQLVKSIRQLITVLPKQIEEARISIEALLESRPEWGEWLKRISGSSGNSPASLADTCSGDQPSDSMRTTSARRRGLESSLRAFGLRAASSASLWASLGSYAPSGARRSSRETVERSQPTARAISAWELPPPRIEKIITRSS